MKEATIVRGIKNEHVVRLKAACLNLCAVMLEYVYFDFTPFGGSERVSSLYDFLLLTVSRAVIQQFPFHYRLGQGVGLPTQSRNSASGHYCTMTVTKALQQLLKEKPIICKLADFGESCSEVNQTAQLCHLITANIARRTSVYRAPKLFGDHSEAACYLSKI